MILRRLRALLRLKGLLNDRVGPLSGWGGSYVLAAVLAVAALGLRLWLTPWIVGAQFITFFPAVIISTLLFGTGPGLLAAGLSAISARFALHTGSFTAQDAGAILLFVIVAIMDVAVISALLSSNVALKVSLAEVADLNRRLRADDAKFRDLIEAAPDAMVIADKAGRIVLVNAEAERLFGYARTELVGQPVNRLMPARFHSHHLGRFTAFIDEARNRRMGNGEELYALSKDGREVPIETNLSLLRTRDGGLVCSVIRDITLQRAAEERRTLLLHELNHRVKNTLTTVQAIANQTLNSSPSPQAFVDAFGARLDALSKGHDLLTRNDWTGAALNDLIAEQLRPYETGAAARSQLHGPHVDLPSKPALALSMALSELATNSAKYGALSAEDGSVSVTWDVTDGAGGHRLRLVWREQGGPTVAAAPRRGFGTRLIEQGLAHELGGSARIAFEPDGVRCEIEFPIEDGAA